MVFITQIYQWILNTIQAASHLLKNILTSADEMHCTKDTMHHVSSSPLTILMPLFLIISEDNIEQTSKKETFQSIFEC